MAALPFGILMRNRGIQMEMLHSVRDLENMIDRIGFLPLFAGDEVPGFSVQEMTEPASWWTGDPKTDPWEWREEIANRKSAAYGRFFRGRAGFLSKECLPYFVNYRRDGYDFDARWDDELASERQKKIMDLFATENEEDTSVTPEIFTFEVKKQAGFGAGREKNFEGTLTSLEMEGYLLIAGFEQRRNKKGQAFGMACARLTTPEKAFGYDAVRSRYAEDPKKSLEALKERVRAAFPDAPEQGILRLIAGQGEAFGKQTLVYPFNLLKAIDKEKDPSSWTKDQVSGLYVALGQLRAKQQRVLREKYRNGKSNDAIGLLMNRSAGTISTYRTKALHMLRDPLIAAWYVRGYRENLKACAAGRHWGYQKSDPKEEIGLSDYCLRIGVKVRTFESIAGSGILTVGDLLRAMQDDPKWYQGIRGVGPATAKDLEEKLIFFHFLTDRTN